MKKIKHWFKSVKATTWLWWGLIALLLLSVIVALDIWFRARGWTWMILFGNRWFLLCLILVLSFLSFIAFLVMRKRLMDKEKV